MKLIAKTFITVYEFITYASPDHLPCNYKVVWTTQVNTPLRIHKITLWKLDHKTLITDGPEAWQRIPTDFELRDKMPNEGDSLKLLNLKL